jgi:hypothetical protein
MGVAVTGGSDGVARSPVSAPEISSSGWRSRCSTKSRVGGVVGVGDWRACPNSVNPGGSGVNRLQNGASNTNSSSRIIAIKHERKFLLFFFFFSPSD